MNNRIDKEELVEKMKFYLDPPGAYHDVSNSRYRAGVLDAIHFVEEYEEDLHFEAPGTGDAER